VFFINNFGLLSAQYSYSYVDTACIIRYTVPISLQFCTVFVEIEVLKKSHISNVVNLLIFIPDPDPILQVILVSENKAQKNSDKVYKVGLQQDLKTFIKKYKNLCTKASLTLFSRITMQITIIHFWIAFDRHHTRKDLSRSEVPDPIGSGIPDPQNSKIVKFLCS
jgi:hypothetical protein